MFRCVARVLFLFVPGLILTAFSDGATSAGIAPDITQYEIIRENPTRTGNLTRTEEVLVFRNLGVRLLLRPRYESDASSKSELGVKQDIDHPEVRWLVPGRILEVAWKSTPIAQGRYQTQAAILAEFVGGKLVELLREGYLCHWRSSAYEYFDATVTYTWDSRFELITQETRASYHHNSYDPLPLGEALSEKEYRRDIDFGEKLRYSLKNQSLQLMSRKFFIDLGSRTASASELADAFVLFLAPRYGAKWSGVCTPDERKRMLSALKLDANTPCSGICYGPAWPPRILPPLAPGDDYYPF